MKTKTAHGGMRRSKLLSGTATYLILGFCVVIVLIPILWMVSTSIKIESETITAKMDSRTSNSDVVYETLEGVSVSYLF